MYNICSTFTVALEGHMQTEGDQFNLEGVVMVVVAMAMEENFALATVAKAAEADTASTTVNAPCY